MFSEKKTFVFRIYWTNKETMFFLLLKFLVQFKKLKKVHKQYLFSVLSTDDEPKIFEQLIIAFSHAFFTQ